MVMDNTGSKRSWSFSLLQINEDVSSKASIMRVNTFVDTLYLFHVEVEIVTDNTRQHVLRFEEEY